nr:ribosome silencing factor [Sulfitobacter litoralis]
MPSAGGLSARLKEDNVLSTLSNAVPTATPQAALMTAEQNTATSDALLASILSQLDDDKAEEVVQIDLRGKTAIGDYMVVCSGRSSRQVSAIAEKLAQMVKDDYGRSPKVEGKETGDWVLIDTGDVIVHVFRPEVREFYQLEKMWMTTEAPAVMPH